MGKAVLPYRSHSKVFAEHHPVLGWTLRPGYSLDRVEFGCMESTNSLGFRTPEVALAKPPGVRRIVFLGDSHTEGFTVGDTETYVRLIGDALGAQVEVISLGISGFSTDQELLAYLEYGRAYRPDVVVLQLCSNDVKYNVLDTCGTARKPRFVRYGDDLLLAGVPVPDFTSTGMFPLALREVSSLATFLEGQLRAFHVQRAGAALDVEEAWRVTGLLVRDLRALVHGDGARLVAFNVSSEDTVFDARLRTILRRFDVPFLDISAIYADAGVELWIDDHWSVEGHRRAAACLAPRLAELLE